MWYSDPWSDFQRELGAPYPVRCKLTAKELRNTFRQSPLGTTAWYMFKDRKQDNLKQMFIFSYLLTG